MLKNLISGPYEDVWRILPTDICRLCQEHIQARECADSAKAKKTADAILIALVSRPQAGEYDAYNRFAIAVLNTLKPDLNATDANGATPLMLAVKNHYTDVALSILNYPQNLNVQDKVHATALIYAASYDERYVVRRLLDLNADVDIKGPHGEKALRLSANEAIYEMIKKHSAIHGPEKVADHKTAQNQDRNRFHQRG